MKGRRRGTRRRQDIKEMVDRNTDERGQSRKNPAQKSLEERRRGKRRGDWLERGEENYVTDIDTDRDTD